MNYLDMVLFGAYPYIALTVLLVGSLIRYDREQYTWKASSSQLLEKKQLRKGSIPFHIGVLGIFFGHLVGLLTPHQVWDVLGVSPGLKQVVAIVAGGLFGLLCSYGLVILLNRRLNNPRVRASSSTMDILLLVVLLVQLVLGLGSIFVSVGHLDGAEMLRLMAWAQNIFTFDPGQAVENIHGANLIFKLHIVLGLTLFVLFPFSRLVHMLSVPLKYFGRNYQVVRVKGPRRV